jgi:demethylmenaquinone methyltransferase/2-methoxy-6-polyprenyl-1,4-benzoquinol methylase
MMQKTSDPGPLPPPERKEAFVRDMFRRIASRYDMMNRLMTFGRDRAWRRYTVAQALAVQCMETGVVRVPARVLDVATGTGDLAYEVLSQNPGASVTGVDLVPEMLTVAQRKAEANGRQPAYLAGDALHLPFRSSKFDAVLTAFALRNVIDIPAAFQEMARVTRPGGRLACLEIAKPQGLVFRRLFGLYFYRVVPLAGRWLTGDPTAYRYLPHSLTTFLTPDEVVEAMEASGWANVRYRRLMLGTVAVHVGVRE